MATGDPTAAARVGVDVFVSYTGADEAWATWVAAVLEAEGQTVRVQVWDSPAGTNFVAWINEQMTLAARTVAICSTTYFASHWCTQEWTGALAGNTLTPLRVEDCVIPPVLATIAYRDLHRVDEPTARRRLLEALGLVAPARVSTGFPGRPVPTPVKVLFPGKTPPGAVRVTDADPYWLGVHRAIHLPGIDSNTPPAYVPRDIDHTDNGIRAQLRTAATRGGFVLLVGGSSVGKTRCALEAIKAELPGWWLIHPATSTEITALAAAPPAHTVLWLDETQNYLNGEHGLTGGTVRALLNAGTVLIGTLWPDRYRTFTTPPHPDATAEDPYRWERDTLRLAAVVDVAPRFTPAEQSRARTAADNDRRIQVGLNSPDDGLTQTLAAGPELLRRWTSAETDAPYAWAVITAALDATHLGVRTPLTRDLLRDAAVGYCTPRQKATAPPTWFDDALIYATVVVHGASAILNPVGTGMGQPTGYTAADYLDQHARRGRQHHVPPTQFWEAVTHHVRAPSDLNVLAFAAEDRKLLHYAEQLFRRALDAGHTPALWDLVRLVEKSGGTPQSIEQLLHQAGCAGDIGAFRTLGRLRERAGDRQGAEQAYNQALDAGDSTALRLLARLQQRAGNRQEAERLAHQAVNTGDIAALRYLARLREAEDWQGAERAYQQAFDAGDIEAPRALGWMWERAGNRQGAKRAYQQALDAGNIAAFWDLARLQEEVGDWQGAERVYQQALDAGNIAARWALARLRKEAGYGGQA